MSQTYTDEIAALARATLGENRYSQAPADADPLGLITEYVAELCLYITDLKSERDQRMAQFMNQASDAREAERSCTRLLKALLDAQIEANEVSRRVATHAYMIGMGDCQNGTVSKVSPDDMIQIARQSIEKEKAEKLEPTEQQIAASAKVLSDGLPLDLEDYIAIPEFKNLVRNSLRASLKASMQGIGEEIDKIAEKKA